MRTVLSELLKILMEIRLKISDQKIRDGSSWKCNRMMQGKRNCSLPYSKVTSPVHSNRCVCYHCEEILQGNFFVCTDCHWKKPAEEGYNLCIECYERGDFIHEHAEFLDNHTVFAQMQEKLQGSSLSIANGITKTKSKNRERLEKAFGILTGTGNGRPFNHRIHPRG